MNIVMFSINPLFLQHTTGGASKHLKNIALHLGGLGHDVTILATQAEGSIEPFNWHERVRIMPILRFHQPFPQPYAVPAYDMAAALQDMGDYLQKADRFYMHDGEFLFPYIYQHVPTVISLRDNVYPETLIGSFLFQADKLILISEYSRLYFTDTVGRFFPALDERIEIIHNGLDFDLFQPTTPDEILKIIPVEPDAQPILLHPHRPEESKGIWQTIATADVLVHEHGFTDLIVLAPRWLDLQLTPDLRDFYNAILADIAERGLQKNFIFHDWIPQALMPQYYTLGTVTFSLGNFVESFGNSVYESLACGTPSVVARISTHRELLPEDLIDKVDYGDIQAAAQKAARIIRNKERTRPQTMTYLHEHYAIDKQLQAYADVILNAKVAEPLVYQHPVMEEMTRFKLASWCYMAGQGVYHDFLAGYRDLTGFDDLLLSSSGFTVQEAAARGIPADEVMGLYREGYFVPVAD